MMRIAIVQETVDVQRGGAETSTVEMARNLAALGLDVTVVCRAADDATDSDAAVPGVAFERIRVTSGSRIARVIGFVRGADRHCREEGYDIVHAVMPCMSANVYQPRGGTYAETIARNVALERSIVARMMKWVDRRLSWRQRFLVLLERELLRGRRRPHVAAVSDYVRRQVVDGFDYPADLVRVVFNGVDVDTAVTSRAGAELRARERIPDATPLVLFVGHNYKLKGLRELLIAFARLDAPGVVLIIAGDGKRPAYERLARRLRLADRVRWLGATADLSDWYAAADVLAHPTWYDPCSRVVLEALSYGLPVVTTCFNGAAEMMQPDKHGVVLDSPADATALANAIKHCLSPELKHACQAVAGEFRQQASMARHARELAAFYEHVVAARKAMHGTIER